MMSPAEASIVPEVTMVGKARFIDSTMAFFSGSDSRSSMKRLEITMA